LEKKHYLSCPSIFSKLIPFFMHFSEKISKQVISGLFFFCSSMQEVFFSCCICKNILSLIQSKKKYYFSLWQ